jgi:hypothetical protein
VPFSKPQSLVAVALGVATQCLVIALGVGVPHGDPLRDTVDNALLMLGGCAILIVLFVPPSGLLSSARTTRVGLGLYGGLGLAAVLLTDFGEWRAAGWAVKFAAAGLFALSLRGLRRPH